MGNTNNNQLENTKKNAKKLNTPPPQGADNKKRTPLNPKLKKALIISGIAVLAVAILALIAVLIFRSSPIGKILTKLQKSESYQMSATISGIPFIGSITLEQMVDENITYTAPLLFSSEQYKEKVGDDTYIYTKDSTGKWSKKLSTESNNSFDKMAEDLLGDLDELTNPRNYEKVKGEKNKYKQKDNVEFDGCKDVVISIGDGEITVEMEISLEGISLPATVVISKIGEIELTLPEVA